MESVNQEDLRKWVAEQTACLNPPAQWHPDPVVALMRFHSRVEAGVENTRPRPLPRRWPLWSAIAAFAVALAAAAVLLPVGRAMAQQIWQFLTVRQVAFVRVNSWPKGVPSPQVKLSGVLIPPIPARDLDEAAWRVQYSPRLPRAGVLTGAPRLSTTFSLTAATVIHAADLELALHETGVTDQSVPAAWDGAQLALHTSSIVIAEWPDVALVQSLPLTLTAPPGLDFPSFSALVLRILGVGPDQARQLAVRMGTTPAWLAPIAPDLMEGAAIEELELNSGPATLVQEIAADGELKRISILWSSPDRVFLLSGKLSRELAIATANAVP
jgi:hypothetical protein